MAKQRKRAGAADECAILALVAQKPCSIRNLAEEIGLPQKEIRRVLDIYRKAGAVHQLWALTPLATENDGISVGIAQRRTAPFTLCLFPKDSEVAM